MAQPSEIAELLDAWRALRGSALPEGWKTIPVCSGGPRRLLAGRHHPGDEEALLIDIGHTQVPTGLKLPQGKGFSVERVDVEGIGPSTWIGLSRRAGGSLDLFATMAVDLVRTLSRMEPGTPRETLEALIDRIRAWQIFMDRSGDGLLSAEDEKGLIGELVVLEALIAGGVARTAACESWTGPLDGVQDFRCGAGAIEVKTSSAPLGSFPAKVGSLDQLDDSLISPLFLAAVRLAQDPTGATLPERVGAVTALLVGQPGALIMFEDRLLRSGYLHVQAERYTRRYSLAGVRYLPVSAGFPRLTRSGIHGAILEARYMIDLDVADLPQEDLTSILTSLGVI